MGCAPSVPAEVVELGILCKSDSSYTGQIPPTAAGQIKTLTRLCLSGCKTIKGEEGCTILAAALPHFKSLEELDLTGCPLGGFGLLALNNVLSQGTPPNLQRLFLGSTVDAAGGTAIGHLGMALATGDFKKFSVLDLGGNAFGPKGAIALAKALSTWRPPLSQLVLSDCHVGASGAAALLGALQSIPEGTALRLDLFSNQIGVNGATAVAELLCAEGAPHVTHLSLQASAFGSEGTVALAEGLSSPSTATSLEALDLSSNGIGNDGLEGVAALANAFTTRPPEVLKVLNLAENSLQAQVEAPTDLLTALRKLSAITWLDLSYNELRADIAETLAGTLGALTTLDTFGLNNNPRLGDEAMVSILGSIGSLKKLHACSTGMGDAAAKVAATIVARDGTPLTHLDVRDNNEMSAAAKDELRGAATAQTVVLLPGDAGDDTTLGLGTRKMWFQWLGEGAFIPTTKLNGRNSTSG